MLILGAFLAPGCGVPPVGEAAAPKTSGAAGCEPALRDFAPRLVLTGEVVTRDALPINVPVAPVWPMKVRFLVEDGHLLAAGERIAEFDGSELYARIDELEARLDAAAGELEGGVSQAAAELAELELTRRRLRADRDRAKIAARLPPELVSAREAAQKQLDLERAELELANAEAKLEHSREAQGSAVALKRLQRQAAAVELAELREILERMVLRAPAAGVFFASEHPREARPIQVGDDIWPGFLLGRIPSAAGWQVEARLLDVDDGRVAAGQAAEVVLDSDPGRRFPATLRHVDQVAQEISNESPRRAFAVLVDVPGLAAGGEKLQLRPGMAARVEVAAPARRVMVLPRRCLEHWLPASGTVLGCSAQDCEIGAPAGAEEAPR